MVITKRVGFLSLVEQFGYVVSINNTGLFGFHTSPIKKRDNSTESPRLVSLLNGCQVVRMVELLGLLGCVDYIRKLRRGYEVAVRIE